MTTSDLKRKIVVVEDDPAQARLITKTLAGNIQGEFEIETFTDASDAATFLKVEFIDVLVTDLDMPEVNGLQLVQIAKQRSAWTQTLIMTAASTTPSILEAGDLGTSDYLLKPLDHNVLVSVVQQSLERLDRWQAAFCGTLQRNRELRLT